MRLGILEIRTKGKPEERHFGPFGEVKERFKQFRVPDSHATLYAMDRVRVKHIPSAPVVVAAPAVTAAVAVESAPEPKQTPQKKGK